MRTARPVGLTDDGQFIIVETADGESISIPADNELRAALRNRPRRHLENELEQSMTPREIQMKIRGGASVDEIVEISGMPAQRVEAFAAPVLAERNHIAGLAQVGSIRRTGEPAGHRPLRTAVTERLRERGVDPDTVEWDAFKMDDGRWSVSASYRVEQADRVAIFYFDQRGRFSVSGNDEARWVVGERTQDQPAEVHTTGRFDEVDTEPTLKLAGPADELALLRAIETNELSQDEVAEAAESKPEVEVEPETEALQDPEPEPEAGSESEANAESDAGPAADGDPEPQANDETEAEAVDEPEIHHQADGVVREESSEAAIPDEPSQLDLLYDLLGSDGYTEDSIRVFEGLSDAAAVPQVTDGGWQQSEESEEPEQIASAEQPEPVEQDETAQTETAEQPEPAEQPESAEQTEPAEQTDVSGDTTGQERDLAAAEDSPAGGPVTGEDRPEQFADGATQDTLPGAEPPATAEPEAAPEAETEVERPAPKPKKRKRAAVPSWDEIMFGSPGSKGK